MKFSLGRPLVVGISLMLASASLFAAPGRSVTIVVERDGAPVANARVLIAADEMDAVGFTDAQGRVVVTTSSTRVRVVADKDGAEGAGEGTDATLTVALTGGRP
jgi:hypothetical protein